VELADAQREVETISRVYARLHGIERTDDWAVLKLGEEVGELTRAYLAATGRSRHQGEPAELADALRDEVADVLGMLMIVAHRLGVDLDEAVERKWLRWKHLVEEQDRLPAPDQGVTGLGLTSPGVPGQGT